MPYATTAPALAIALHFILLKIGGDESSWRAPALSAMAFQPFCVGTVTRILTLPRASLTGRIRQE
jgi:hypothetical protein